jgi:N-methylhydantoinase B
MTVLSTTELDPIGSQILLTQIQAIADEAFRAIEHTAVSPAVAEALDGSCALLDPAGHLIVGGGFMDTQPRSASIAVGSIIARHGDSIVPGDIFIGNDPHSDCALHPQDVVVAKPVYFNGKLTAWVSNVAHMTDMGGMRFGSWAPDATECFQEALRLPPIRLFAAGVERTEVWEVIRNNVRLPNVVEMDLRSLVAGCNVAEEKLLQLIEAKGGGTPFLKILEQIQSRVAAELRDRILAIEDGTYQSISWTEWDDEFFKIPCQMTVKGSEITFDFEGASPQCDHLFNSRPWIVQAVLVPNLWSYLAPDLPLTHAVFEAFQVKCPEGSVLNSYPPAPVASAHVDASGIAADVGVTCFVMALSCSTSITNPRLTAQLTEAGSAIHTWKFEGLDGGSDGCLALDGSCSGSPAGERRDGVDFLPFRVRGRGRMDLIDIEVLESWYPLLVGEKRPRPGPHGAGKTRGGAGCQMQVQPHGTKELTGAMLGRREHLPFQGTAGGFPGGTMEFLIHRSDGTEEPVGAHDTGVVIGQGDVFEFRATSGGGFGDPLDRDPQRVIDDVVIGRLSNEEALSAYGVVVGEDAQADLDATAVARAEALEDRLRRSAPAAVPLSAELLDGESEELSGYLYPGVVQRGRFAVAEESGALLAVAPNAWVDGCRVLHDQWRTRAGRDIEVHAYLDPRTGKTLLVDATLQGSGRSFSIEPRRWMMAGS